MYYLGTISVLTTAVKNNVNTAVPFAIPASCKALMLESDVSAVQFALGVGASFVTDANKGAFIKALKVLQGPYRTGGISPTLSIYNPTGGTCNVKVYAVG